MPNKYLCTSLRVLVLAIGLVVPSKSTFCVESAINLTYEECQNLPNYTLQVPSFNLTNSKCADVARTAALNALSTTTAYNVYGSETPRNWLGSQVVTVWANSRRTAWDANRDRDATVLRDVTALSQKTLLLLAAKQVEAITQMTNINEALKNNMTAIRTDIQVASTGVQAVKDDLTAIETEINRLGNLLVVYNGIAKGLNSLQKCQNSLAPGFRLVAEGQTDNTTVQALEEHCNKMENYTSELNVSNETCPERRLSSVDDYNLTSSLPSAFDVDWCHSMVNTYMQTDVNWGQTEAYWISAGAIAPMISAVVLAFRNECQGFLAYIRTKELLAAVEAIAHNYVILASMVNSVKTQTSEVAAISSSCASDMTAVTNAYEIHAENFLKVLKCQTLLTDRLTDIAKITTSTTATTRTQTTVTTTITAPWATFSSAEQNAWHFGGLVLLTWALLTQGEH